MARKPTARCYASRKAFYCQWQGKQHRFRDGPDDSPAGPNYLAALEAFRHVMQHRNTVRVILKSYLAHIESRCAVKTYRLRRDSFASVGELDGDVFFDARALRAEAGEGDFGGPSST